MSITFFRRVQLISIMHAQCRAIIQEFADQQAECYEIYRANVLKQIIRDCNHAMLREVMTRWFRACKQKIEECLRIETTMVLRSFLLHSGLQCVLIHALARWKQFVVCMHCLQRDSDLKSTIRHLESLCIQLKLERANDAFTDSLEKLYNKQLRV